MRLRHPKTMLGFASLVVATFSIIPLPSPVAGAATTGHPNIVLILTDDMRWDEMENMPTVENELVAKGVNFTNAFVSNSLCCPSRASTLTGQFSHTNGVWRNAPPYGGYKAFLPHESDTVATRLHAAGYTTGLVGKYMNGYTAKATRNPSGLASRPGWDTWVAFLGGNPISESPAYFNYTLDVNGASQVYGTTEADYSTDVLGAKATEFVRNAPRTAPWFLYFAPYGPHHPYTPAQRYTTSLPNCPKGVNPPGCYRSHPSPNLNEADVSDKPAWVQALSPTQHSDAARKQQEQNLLAVDDSVRNIMQAVADRGELSNTVFVFTSDNSLSGGSHRWPAKETGWDEALHVPLVVRYDPLTAGSTNATDMVLNADFTPSAVDIAGLAQDTSFDGSSWLPLLTNPGAPWRTAFPIEHLAQGTSNPPTYCGVRTDGWPELSGRWKYLRYINGEQELYDLVADPFELQSLHADPAYATQLQKLHDLAQQLCNPPPEGYGW